MISENMSEGLEFQQETYFKFIYKNLTTKGFTYKLGLNTDTKPFYRHGESGLHYTDIDHIRCHENCFGDHIMIVKIPIEVPIVKIEGYCAYKSPSLFVESIHLYTDFLKDDSIVPEIKRSMKTIDLRMGIHRTKENCLEAVKNSGYNIRYIIDSPFLDKEICMAAVENYGNVIEYIKDSPLLDKEICMIAVKYSGDNIRYIIDSLLLNKEDPRWDPDFLKEICLEAVKNSGYNIKYLIDSLLLNKEDPRWDPNFLKEICMAAVEQDGTSIQYIMNSDFIDKEICMAAVENNCRSIRYIKDSHIIDKEICLTAIEWLLDMIDN